MTRFAVSVGKHDEDAVKFVQWVTATAIPDAPVGSPIRVAHWAAPQLYEWHWGRISASALKRDATRAADYFVGLSGEETEPSR